MAFRFFFYSATDESLSKLTKKQELNEKKLWKKLSIEMDNLRQMC